MSFELTDDQENALAEASKEKVMPPNADGSVIKTKILPVSTFYPAESYHQDYYTKNPLRYKYYRWGCGRDARLKALWGEEAGGSH